MSAPLSVSLIHVIYAEVTSVQASMRKNSRWASSAHHASGKGSALASSMGLRRPGTLENSRSSRQHQARKEHDLMLGFEELKRKLNSTPDIQSLPLTEVLLPFLDLIRSPLSTGPITSAALNSLYTFFISGLINTSSAEVLAALSNLSHTVAHCKFESSDSASDEVVLLRILAVIKECMCGKVGSLLGDVEVCEMLETVLTTCCQMRLSELLRRSAETTMHALVRQTFSCLRRLDPTVEEAKLLENDDPTTPKAEPGQLDAQDPEADPTPAKPFGLASAIELLRVLINLVDPNDPLHTDSMRLTALGILNAALEVAGPDVGRFPTLRLLMLDQGCKSLFQLARSDNASILYYSLRVISTLFATMRQHLKLQQELLLSFMIDRLTPPPVPLINPKTQLSVGGSKQNPGVKDSASPASSVVGDDAVSEDSEYKPPSRARVAPAIGETRELMLETLSGLARHPSFMVDLWINYDCDYNCEDLFERLISFLTKSVSSALRGGGYEVPQQTSQLLCLDLLLAFVDHMARRSEEESEPWPEGAIPPQQLLESKSRKKTLLTGAARFNTKPKAGLEYLEEHKLIYADVSDDRTKAESLARFLKTCPRLDKKLLGDFISRPANLDVLHAFVKLFDFRTVHVADALRQLLETFRLPGEAQQIGRITETFAEVYFDSKPPDIKTQDAVYVLAYAVIMLNTDLHNPQIRKRMTPEDFRRNLRGVNGGDDFTPEYLNALYESIQKKEIVLPEEHTGQLGFEFAWKELLQRSSSAGSMVMCNTPIFDQSMFKLVWKPVISAISSAFTTFDDDHVIQRAISGFRQMATLAAKFQMSEVFDYIVMSLSHVTGLLDDTHIPRSLIFPTAEVEGQSITISALSVKFGTNFRGQLAAVVLFTISNGNGNFMRQGWTQIFEMFETLFLHSLLPTRMLQMEDFLGGVSMIPLQGSQRTQPAGRPDGGLLSALSSYLLTPYGSSTDAIVHEATEEEIEHTLCTVDCITSCKLDVLYRQIMQLEVESLLAAVRALQAIADKRTSGRLQAASEETDFRSPSPSMGRGAAGYGPLPLPYDPASVFLLEMMVSIASQSSQHVEEVWPIAFEHLSALLSHASSYSILLIERAVVGLLRLCQLVGDKNSLRDQLYVALDLLGDLPSDVNSAVAGQLMSGLTLIIQDHRQVIRSQTEWSLTYGLIRSAIAHHEASKIAFDLIKSLVASEDRVTADNFGGLVTILDEFATAAGLAVESRKHQQQRRGAAQGSAPGLTIEPIVERGCSAIELVFELKKFLPRLLQSPTLTADEAFNTFTLPLLVSLSRQATNPCREVRDNAITLLQRVLLGPQLSSANQSRVQVNGIFSHSVFPLVEELLDDEVFARDPQGMAETRSRACALLCKVFLHYETRMNVDSFNNDIRGSWLKLLDLLDGLMHIDRRSQLYEAVPESLKNVLLVMNASDLLLPPTDPDKRDEHQKALWLTTVDRLSLFLPGFLDDIFPPLPPPPPTPALPRFASTPAADVAAPTAAAPPS